jgi:hypothetical protein
VSTTLQYCDASVKNKSVSKIEADEINFLYRECTESSEFKCRNVLKELNAYLLNRKIQYVFITEEIMYDAEWTIY